MIQLRSGTGGNIVDLDCARASGDAADHHHLDSADQNLLRDDLTVIDHALTGPWTVTKTYRRDPNPRPIWTPEVCAEGNPLVRIGNDAYYLSPEGILMPVTKGQPPPDLRYFNQTRK
jgi:hypothetical protein